MVERVIIIPCTPKHVLRHVVRLVLHVVAQVFHRPDALGGLFRLHTLIFEKGDDTALGAEMLLAADVHVGATGKRRHREFAELCDHFIRLKHERRVGMKFGAGRHFIERRAVEFSDLEARLEELVSDDPIDFKRLTRLELKLFDHAVDDQFVDANASVGVARRISD